MDNLYQPSNAEAQIIASVQNLSVSLVNFTER